MEPEFICSFCFQKTPKHISKHTELGGTGGNAVVRRTGQKSVQLFVSVRKPIEKDNIKTTPNHKCTATGTDIYTANMERYRQGIWFLKSSSESKALQYLFMFTWAYDPTILYQPHTQNKSKKNEVNN